MSNGSILGAERAATRAKGRDVDALGPSDTSDSGSDVQGERVMSTEGDNDGELGALPVDLASDSDASGTGERGSATGDDSADAADILPDRIATDPLFAAQIDSQGDDVASDSDVDVEDLAAGDDEEDEEDDDEDESVVAKDRR